jgi:predicted nucleic acid-binding protein
LFGLFTISELHLPRMTQLMIKYADLPMDLADASLVLLAEELGHGRIVSTDRRDFHTYRWKNHQPFTNLLDEVL